LHELNIEIGFQNSFKKASGAYVVGRFQTTLRTPAIQRPLRLLSLGGIKNWRRLTAPTTYAFSLLPAGSSHLPSLLSTFHANAHSIGPWREWAIGKVLTSASILPAGAHWPRWY